MGILRLATLPTRLHVPKYDWDEALQMDLEEALIEFKQLRLMGQILTLRALSQYLLWRIPSNLLEPLESIYTELMNKAAALVADDRPGPRPAPLSEKIVEARAAATVTVLKNCRWKVSEAIERVAKVTGLEADRLRYFRDENS